MEIGGYFMAPKFICGGVEELLSVSAKFVDLSSIHPKLSKFTETRNIKGLR